MTNIEIGARSGDKKNTTGFKSSENLPRSNHNGAQALDILGNVWDVEYNRYVDKIVELWDVIQEIINEKKVVRSIEPEYKKIVMAADDIMKIVGDKNFIFLYNVAEKKDKERPDKTLSEFITFLQEF